jgi:hypothetical protein
MLFAVVERYYLRAFYCRRARFLSQLLDSAKRFLVCFAFRSGGRLFVQTAI